MLKVLLAVLVIALVVYGVTRLVERRGLPRPSRAARREPPRPVAPDDDPDFLWRLEAERRRQAKQNGGAPSGTPPSDATDGGTEPQDEAPDEDSTGTT